MLRITSFLFALATINCLERDVVDVALDYVLYRDVRHVCYLGCGTRFGDKIFVKQFMQHNIPISMKHIDEDIHLDVSKFLNVSNIPIGVILDGTCKNSHDILLEASYHRLFNMAHVWLVLNTSGEENNKMASSDIMNIFQRLNLSVDADVVVVTKNYGGNANSTLPGNLYQLTDVYNFGKIQGNNLEMSSFGTWRRGSGMAVALEGYKYYNRWDFHNLTFRAITVILDEPEDFQPSMLTEEKYTKGVAAVTKIASQLLYVLKEQHNFGFKYTIVSRWFGDISKNATKTIAQAMYWEEQDLASTSARVFAHWLGLFSVAFPPTTYLQTKFYYLISERGVGSYENRFLSPMSPAVWYVGLATAVVCAVALSIAAGLETRPQPGHYAFFSVVATICQQAYEDGVQILEEAFSSQGRRLTLLVIGLTSMLLYNYYTSSVVSWLLSAAPPSIASLDQLITSDLELVFEDIGYSRGWLINAGLFYYSGFKNPIEDRLRDAKVTHAKRTTPVLQSVEAGIELIRSGRYAFHTEPYTASQVIAKKFEDEELCSLGELQMMRPAPLYIWLQRRSPYKEFFVWSLMRLLERGHVKASRARFAGAMPACSGQRPRALALGQAAPAFLLLFLLTLLSLFILMVEILWHRAQAKKDAPNKKWWIADNRRGRSEKTIKGRRLTSP